jgi:hypothetical protein
MIRCAERVAFTRAMSRCAADRRGTSVVEALVALVLTALLVHLTWFVAAALKRAAFDVIERSEALDAERLGWHVLSTELAAGTPVRDFQVANNRVLPLRAFRGTGEVCSALRIPEGGLVRYGGMRAPEPAKDSLLALTESGTWHVLRLTHREPVESVCPGHAGGSWERWRWEPPLADVLLARVFERGTYHIENRAVRYQSQEGGRQPLTPERLVDAGSAFAASATRVELRLRVRAEANVLWESSRSLARMQPPDD